MATALHVVLRDDLASLLGFSFYLNDKYNMKRGLGEGEEGRDIAKGV